VPHESVNAAAWLIVGLGNPGPEYEGTYHNVGFRVIEKLARRQSTALKRRTVGGCAVRVGRFKKAVLVQPLTYMNRSGDVLGGLMDTFGPDARLLVVSDDLALPLGKIRIRERGSAGGHNGLKSISSAYGSNEYLRVRVGIMPARGFDDTKGFVLSRVATADHELLESVEDLAADAVELILEGGARSAMARFNGVDMGQAEEDCNGREGEVTPEA
jgi:PTH1 family peptidyl-tRNA hydrolase